MKVVSGSQEFVLSICKNGGKKWLFSFQEQVLTKEQLILTSHTELHHQYT